MLKLKTDATSSSTCNGPSAIAGKFHRRTRQRESRFRQNSREGTANGESGRVFEAGRGATSSEGAVQKKTVTIPCNACVSTARFHGATSSEAMKSCAKKKNSDNSMHMHVSVQPDFKSPFPPITVYCSLADSTFNFFEQDCLHTLMVTLCVSPRTHTFR